jgi:hypothetical protein
MLKLLIREIALVLITGLFGTIAMAALFGLSVAPVFFGLGVGMAMTFAAVYVLVLMGAGRMRPTTRLAVAALAWVGAFADGIWRGYGTPAFPVPGWLAPTLALIGPVLVAIAILRRGRETRLSASAWALYAYSLPMLVVRWLLVPLVGSFSYLALLALIAGTFYNTLRVLLRLFYPNRIEGNLSAPQLVYRPVPDAVVGLVEGTTGLRARPFATGLAGELDETVISVLCQPDQAGGVVSTITQAVTGRPFMAVVGERVGDQVEVIVRATP